MSGGPTSNQSKRSLSNSEFRSTDGLTAGDQWRGFKYAEKAGNCPWLDMRRASAAFSHPFPSQYGQYFVRHWQTICGSAAPSRLSIRSTNALISAIGTP
jgi:hypothetical protein